MQKITDLFYGMKLFDSGGDYFGRVLEINEADQTLTYLTPSQGTYTLSLAETRHPCQNGFWLQQPNDPAVQFRWKSQSDVPTSKPGLTFEDGLALQTASRALRQVGAGSL